MRLRSQAGRVRPTDSGGPPCGVLCDTTQLKQRVCQLGDFVASPPDGLVPVRFLEWFSGNPSRSRFYWLPKWRHSSRGVAGGATAKKCRPGRRWGDRGFESPLWAGICELVHDPLRVPLKRRFCCKNPVQFPLVWPLAAEAGPWRKRHPSRNLPTGRPPGRPVPLHGRPLPGRPQVRGVAVAAGRNPAPPRWTPNWPGSIASWSS
jgi:hypothetical protein